MKFLVLTAVLLGCATALPAFAVSETEEGFATAMQGCWTQTRWGSEIEKLRTDPDFTIAATMCLAGGVTGQVQSSYCDGRPVIDCWESAYDYAFRDNKFWRFFENETPDGRTISCDVRLSPGKSVELRGCIGHADDGSALGAVDDAVFEKQATQ